MPDSLFSSHITFLCPGVKVSDSIHGRLSGGLVLFVRKQFSHLVQQLHIETDNTLVLKLKAELLGQISDCLLIGTYLPPENAKYYEETDIYNGVSMLEDCLIEVVKEHGDLPLILFGDLNSRTGTCNFSNTDPLDGIYELIDENHDNNCGRESDTFSRISKDSIINAFGKYLLSICEEFGLIIVNGLKSFHCSSDFTFISDQGCSVIDYFVVSQSLLLQLEHFQIIPVVETKHAAIEMLLFVENTTTLQNRINTVQVTSCDKYKWDDQHSGVFVANMNSDFVKKVITEATFLVDIDINQALSKFNECLVYAGECMKRTVYFGTEKRKVWFDLECRQSRQVLRRHLHTFIKRNTDTDRHTYMQKRREYKELLKQKKKFHREKIKISLQCNIKNPKQFWDTVRSVRPRSTSQNTISAELWYKHFNNVFNESVGAPENDDFDTVYSNVDFLPECEELNGCITVFEIELAIKSLKNQKAAGPDGLIGEFYRNSFTNILPFLHKLFNYIFEYGIFPEDWSVALLHPLHKKGDLNQPDNYRGISLLNICSKLYSFVLNKRITRWVELNSVIGEEQAGFRENRCTTDNIFTLLACAQKQLVRHRKLYVAFIDFRKAFDLVCRDKLWVILNANGVNGKMLNALKSMYAVVKARVRSGANLSDVFFCPRGLKQGEVCSPILFSLLINELTKEINENGKHGVQLSPDIIQLLILLFADDIALLSDSIVGLQTQLNILYRVAERLDLVVNLEKSNIVVFRNGGFLARNENWYFGTAKLSVVNMYKYLGVCLTTRLSFQPTMLDLADRANKGVSAIIRMLWSVGEHSPEFFFKLFDSQIQPILTYGADIWGLTTNQTIIERVHLAALKRFLCISQKAPKHLIYSELGRYPLYVNTYAKCIRFWLRIVCMDETRLPKKAYNMLMSLQRQNYSTWACKVRNVLFMFGFGVVWEAQSVGNIKVFIALFKQRLKDCFLQDWHAALQSHTFYSTYSSFVSSFSLRLYFHCITSVNVRKIFTRFRLGMLPLRGHFLQYDNARRNLTTSCPFCDNNAVETEFHFLLVCPKYNTLRQQYIPQKFCRQPTLFKMSLLLATENNNLIVRSCIYVYKAYVLRTKQLESMQ